MQLINKVRSFYVCCMLGPAEFVDVGTLSQFVNAINGGYLYFIGH